MELVVCGFVVCATECINKCHVGSFKNITAIVYKTISYFMISGLLLFTVYQSWRVRYQSGICWHCSYIWFWLESTERSASTG